MRVLQIEDDSCASSFIEMMLRAEGMNVYTTDSGEEGESLARHYDYDIILLNLTLPDISGYEVLRRLRTAKVKTPVLVLSHIRGVDVTVKCLNGGADEFMTKPVHKDELVARIGFVVRRSRGHVEQTLTTGDLTVHMGTKTITVGDQSVHLTGKEYGVVELLALRKGTTVTKEAFLNHLYGGMDEPHGKIIDVFICKLRKKLSLASGGKNYIENVRGRGYTMREPVPAMLEAAE